MQGKILCGGVRMLEIYTDVFDVHFSFWARRSNAIPPRSSLFRVNKMNVEEEETISLFSLFSLSIYFLNLFRLNDLYCSLF